MAVGNALVTNMVAAKINSVDVGGEALVTGETNAMGIDFTYDTQVNKQMRVITASVPVNSDPATKLTYTSPSVKITRRVDGLWTATNGTTELPYEWNTASVPQGLLFEEQRTNLCLRSDDLTNASWTKSNLTTAFTSTGPGGVINTATRCTSTAGNATALQAIVSASAERISSMFVKRITGSGNIDITQNNGSTWTTVTTTTSWTRVELPKATTTDPTVGLRIVTSGDAVDVALFDHEVGGFTTSPIQTAGASVTRAKDQITLLTSAFPHDTTKHSVIASFQIPAGMGATVAARRICSLGNTTDPEGDEFEGMSFLASSADIVCEVFQGSFSFQCSDIAAVTPTTGVTQKYGYAIQTNDAAAVLNGGTVGTDVTCSVPTTDRVGFGTSGALSQLNGYLRQYTYLARRATNGELQTRTT